MKEREKNRFFYVIKRNDDGYGEEGEVCHTQI